MKADLCYGFSSADWEKLSHNLDADETIWPQAIGVFERRMKERFFSCIDALVQADTKPDPQSASSDSDPCIPGFSIVALCCLLIDTLQGFRESATVSVPTGPCDFPKKPCIRPSPGTNEQFRKFLHLPAFGKAFEDNKVTGSFLHGIRNGILHKAETRKWVIWRDEPHGQIVAAYEDGHALNRTLFYAAVKKEFESYLGELRSPDKKDLRKRFRDQMQKLCDET